jgi:hypothetical protein
LPGCSPGLSYQFNKKEMMITVLNYTESLCKIRSFDTGGSALGILVPICFGDTKSFKTKP